MLNPVGALSQKQKLIMAAIASFVVTMLLSLYFFHYDSEHWVYTIDSIESGNGIYGLNGFYYPPLYGYILSFLALMSDMFGIPITGINPIDTDAPVVLGKFMYYHPAFSVIFKLIDALAAVAIGYMIYVLVKDCTGREDTAYKSALIWYFCPIVIQMVGVQGQFDVLAILTALMCIIALRKKSYFLAGALFATSVLIKVFFAPCIVALVLYIWLCEKDMKKTVRYTVYAAVGALLVTVLTYIPLVLDGTWQYSITFITDRASREWYTTLATLAGAIPMLLMVLLCAVHMTKSESENAQRELIIWSALLFGMAATMSPGYQYGPWIAVMILMLWATMDDNRLYLHLFWGVSIFSTLQAITITHLYQIWMGSYYWGIPSYIWVTEMSMAIHPVMSAICLVISPVYIILTLLALILTVMTLFKGKNSKIDSISEKIRSLGGTVNEI